MSWKDDLQKVTLPDSRRLIAATYRGVPFFVESHERAGGRRVVTREFPFQDTPAAEDLGRKAGVFSMEGYVLGDDYLIQANSLLAALEDTAGPGQLQHPRYGVLQVICSSVRVRETQREGGWAVFSLEFSETAEERFPEVSLVPEELIGASVVAAEEAVSADFVAAYEVEDEPNWTMEDLADVLISAATAMEEGLAPAITTAQELAAFRAQLDDLAEDAASLVRRPTEVVERLFAVTASLVAVGLLPALLETLAFAPAGRPEGETATRQRQRVNWDALAALVRRALITQASRLAPQAEFDSYDAALDVREVLTTALDAELNAAGDDAYPALHQLRADLVRGLPGEGGDLPRLINYTPPATVPSLVLAHRLYGSLELESDILARNHSIQHPGFARGGEELEVLSGG